MLQEQDTSCTTRMIRSPWGSESPLSALYAPATVFFTKTLPLVFNSFGRAGSSLLCEGALPPR